MLPTIAWEGDVVVMVDQRKLPAREVYVRARTATEVAKAIKTMEGRQQPRTSAFADQDAKTLGKKRDLEGDYLLSAAASHESSSRRSAQSGRRAAVEAKLRRQSTNARVI